MSQSSRPGPGNWGMQVQWTPKLIAWLVLLVLTLILVLQNRARVDVNVFFWDFHIRLVWALLGVFLLGALLGWMVPRIRAGARQRQRR